MTRCLRWGDQAGVAQAAAAATQRLATADGQRPTRLGSFLMNDKLHAQATLYHKPGVLRQWDALGRGGGGRWVGGKGFGLRQLSSDLMSSRPPQRGPNIDGRRTTSVTPGKKPRHVCWY